MSSTFASIESLERRQHLSAGELDLSFAGGAGFTTVKSSVLTSSHRMAVQADGKVLLSYTEAPNSSVADSLRLRRFNADGTIDTTFGTGGTVAVAGLGKSPTFGLLRGVGLYVTPDQRILLAGQADYNNDGDLDAAIVRLNSNGTLDTSFNTSGLVYYDPTNGSERINDIAIDAQGGILVAGYSDSQFGDVLWRHLSTGPLDTSFSFRPTTGQPEIYGEAKSVIVTPAGAIWIGGSFSSRLTSLFRVDATGQVQQTVQLPTGSGFWDMAVDSQQRLVVVGDVVDSSLTPSARVVQVLRYLPSGDADNTFSGNGQALISNLGTEWGPAGLSVIALPDDRLLVSSYVRPSQNATGQLNGYVFRMTTAGALDGQFGNSGRVRVLSQFADVRPFDLAVHNGAFYVGGSVYQLNVTPQTEALLAKYDLYNDARISGFVYDDANKNGTLEIGENGLLAGHTVYLDRNNNGFLDSGEPSMVTQRDGYWFIAEPGTYQLRVIPAAGWSSTSPDTAFATVGYEKNARVDFGVTQSVVPTTGSISGVTFDDSNKNGQLDSGETKTSGKTVFLDSNNNGTLDTGEKSTTTSTTGAYSFTNLPAGTYYVRRMFPSGYTYSNLPLNLTLAGGQNITNANIGSVPVGTPPPPPPPPPGQTGSIAGFTFDDKNKNGLLDSGETKTSGKTVFLDTNNNGKLDTGEKSTKTNTSGAYAFTNLSAGTYYVRRVFPSGYTYSNTPLDLALAAGQNITNANIGSIAGTVTPPPPPPPPPTGDPKTASISGFLFWDSDRDGKFDTGESYQTGKTVFIDLDDDNVLDANETKLTTDSKGAFKFTGLSAGTYVIKRVVPTGYKITTPKQVVTLTAGQVFSGVAIGTNT